MKTAVILASLLLLLGACGHDKQPTSSAPPRLTGTYEGPSVFGGHTYTLRIDVVQTGSSASGTYSSTSGDRGTFAANIAGTQFSALLVSTVNAVRCNVTGTIRVDFSGFSGAVACSNRSLGSFDVTRV